MNKFGKMKKILSLFLGAMSFGARGAYAKDDVKKIGASVSSKRKNKGQDVRKVKDAMGKKNSKGKNAKAGIGRRGGKVNVDGNEALRIVKDAKSKGHKVDVKKIGRNKAEVTVTGKNGDVVTYVIGGVVSVLLIAAIIGVVVKCKGTAQGDGDQGQGGNPDQGNEEEKKKKEEEKQKQVLINEIGNLCERFKKFGVDFKVDGLEDLDISGLEGKKTELEESLKKERAKLAPMVGFMLEFSPKEGKSANNLDALLDDDFASVYSEFTSNSLAVSVYNMVNVLSGKIGEADGVIKIAGGDVKTPLGMLGFGSYDELRKDWNVLNAGNIGNLNVVFNEWFDGELWKDHEAENKGLIKKGVDFFKGLVNKGEKTTTNGTTFKQHWESKCKK